MGYSDWDSMLYGEDEFSALYKRTNGFTEKLNSNPPLRPNGMSFEQFMDAGSDMLISENSL